ncbi:hypothetical protein QJS66_22720 [Kocuria rhizophila]|nr:hypothetical protein QJS66_22720 [Kocuria rhizophila]
MPPPGPWCRPGEPAIQVGIARPGAWRRPSWRSTSRQGYKRTHAPFVRRGRLQ